MRSLIVALFFFAPLIGALSAQAECNGQNLLDQMPEAERREIFDRAEAEPFATGNFWTARKGAQSIVLIGTYHLGDPRHDRTMAAIAPLIDSANTVLVEAGPDEERALVDHLAKNPNLMVLTDTSLPELLTSDDWESLSSAMQLRGIPGFMAAKFQPWYVSLLLATPPCDMTNAMGKAGLDAQIIDRATDKAIPVRALEPFDSVFKIFAKFSMADQIDMIRYSLGMEDRVEDFSATLADAYFRGDSRVIWELMRHQSLGTPGMSQEQIEEDMNLMGEAMMTSRNREWIPVIEEAAAKGPTLAAFGALHLSGIDGVANLLKLRGWTLSPLPMPAP